MLFAIHKKSDIEKVIAYLQRLPERLLGYKIFIQTIRRSRSISQNKYAWFLWELIAQETGETAQRVHDYYCQKFLTKEVKIFGKFQKITKGTSELDTKEFEDIMLEVRTDAQIELNVFCPLPNEVIEE